MHLPKPHTKSLLSANSSHLTQYICLSLIYIWLSLTATRHHAPPPIMVHHPHFIVVTFPAQGQINPSLQFAKRLLRVGAHVTYATCVSAHRRMSTTLPHLPGLSFASFSNGYDEGFRLGVDDPEHYMAELQRLGSQSLADIITASADQGRPVTCLVYTLLLPWAAEVARELHVPNALLWVQPATVLDLYYYYFNGYEDVIRTKTKDPSCSVELPGLPLSFTARDLPSFLVSPKVNDAYSFVLPSFQQQIEALDLETNPKILINTFDALEPEALRAIKNLNTIAVGPLVPSVFLDGNDPSDTRFGGDLFERGSDDYSAWLRSKPEASVVYVSFGSLSVMSKRQMEEMGRALLDGRRPFLWVIRDAATVKKTEEKEEEKLSCMEELRELGMIVPWCDQLEVLSCPALGCFVTHCGWNSTMESLVSGVAVVMFPQWTDQGTNAKLVGEAWRTGVRVVANEEGVVESEEIKRCLEMVMGEEGEEMRSNAKKWKELAREAVAEGGTSDKNLRFFVEEVAGDGC